MRKVCFGPHLEYKTVIQAMQADANAIAKGQIDEAFWIGEHALTITLGRSLKAAAQVVAPQAAVVQIERGGGATLHHPGQLVVYPLIRLAEHQLSPVTYLRLLEQMIIEALAADGISAEAIAGQTGVWSKGKKIASLGVSVTSGVTRHGLALNIADDLRDFTMISPCGFSAEVMTRVVDLKATATVADYDKRLSRLLYARLGAALRR